MYPEDFEGPRGSPGSQIPMGEDGTPDLNLKNYGFHRFGARELHCVHYNPKYHNWETTSIGVLIEVTQAPINRQIIQPAFSEKDLITRFSFLEIQELNYNSELLFLDRVGNVCNWAAFGNLVERGIDPKLHLHRWIQKGGAYRKQYLTYRGGARYLLPEERCGERIIEKLLEEAIPCPETRVFFYIFLAGTLFGEQTFKAFVFLINPTKNNGKTVFVIILSRLHGGYARALLPSDLIDDRERTFDKIMILDKGVHFCFVDETGETFRLPESMLKRYSGRAPIKNPYSTGKMKEFKSQAKFLFDSNWPVKPENGTQSSIEDRVFQIAYGKVITQRISHFEDKVSTPENLDEFFSFLVDNYLHRALKGELPERTPYMILADDLFKIRNDPISFFLEKATINLTSDPGNTRRLQDYTVDDVHLLFYYFVKTYNARLMRQLRFDFHSDGTPMTDHELNLSIEVPPLKEFKARVDALYIEADYYNRSSRAYRWPNLYVKDLLVYFYGLPAVRDIYGGLDKVIEQLDRIRTVEQSISSVQPFYQYRDATVLQSLQFNLDDESLLMAIALS